MPRRVNVDEENLSWLKANHSRLSHKELASKFNCCVDIIKRILVRHNLQDFDGAKYQVKRAYEERRGKDHAWIVETQRSDQRTGITALNVELKGGTKIYEQTETKRRRLRA